MIADRRHALAVAAALLTLLAAGPATTFDFDNVVSLGDSLFDVGTDVERAPVVSDHVAAQLGAPHINFAVSGATTGDMIAGGQHTSAAASFGSGDLALVWIGGNDFLANELALAFGFYTFLNTMQSNLTTAVATLRGAGMEVVILSLPDLSLTPGVILNVGPGLLANISAASSQWRDRVANVALAQGALHIDMFAVSHAVDADPSLFELYGVPPELAPAFGGIDTCPSCIYFDQAHPSALAQGFFANEVIDALNAAFDPGGAMPLERLSNLERFNLTQLVEVPLGPVAALGIATALLAAGVTRLGRRRIG